MRNLHNRGMEPGSSARRAAAVGDYGAVIRSCRREAGLSQGQLGEACGYSQSAISRLESRGPGGPYEIGVLRSVGAVLGIADDLLGLTRSRDLPSIRPAEPRPLRSSVTTLADAMLQRSGRQMGEVGDLVALKIRVHEAWCLRQRGDYSSLAALLSSLVRDVEAAVSCCDGESHDQATELSVHTYNAASSLLKRVGDAELASVAADRAIRHADRLGDPLLRAAASYRLANVLLTCERFEESRQVALDAADTIGPRQARSPRRVATWGGLLLTAAIATAKLGTTSDAWELFGAAKVAAELLGTDHVDLFTIFGPTNIAIHAVQVAVELGDGRDAVRRGQAVDVDRLPPHLLERRVHYLTDLARGHLLDDDDTNAVEALLRAHDTAPEELMLDPEVHALVHTMLHRRRHRSRSSPLQELADRIGLAS